MNKVKMILDCDTGHDDAIALMLACGNLDIELLGVTCVAGNAGLQHTVPNTLHVVQHLNLPVKVYAGCDRPIVKEQVVADDVHGKSGLDGPVFEPLTISAEQEHAVNFIIRTIMESDGDVVLVPTGPLTNIAMAMRMEPRIVKKIRHISLMGGSLDLGNTTPAAEFNIYVDPEAADIVFRSGVEMNMMGLNLTNRVLATPQIIARMRNIGNKAGNLFADIMSFTLHSQAVNGLSAGPVHDVTAVAYLVAPQLFTMQQMHVEIDISHGPCYGRTVCDIYDRFHLPKNVNVGMDTDLEGFWNLVEQALRNLD